MIKSFGRYYKTAFAKISHLIKNHFSKNYSKFLLDECEVLWLILVKRLTMCVGVAELC